ncbi:hypothetical protein FJ651_14550 [Paucihalobacter ruber]|uniref:Uncharacterized protein n=1 Tax=Paucihalobacter ruber TaxID=2567861 RepID=A0A506PBP6_9FLAO|nr:hypothetical protein [Paucihalobacter ruber]TPV31411.1 hypothetical protein FJ651_14550 [Paucihalobacter ruber]
MKKYISFWNLDYKRNILLGLLSQNRIDYTSRKKRDIKLGVSFDVILSKLKCDKYKLEEITSELYEEKEILYTDVDHKGLYATNKGVVSSKNNKYKKKYEDLWIIMLRNISQILIPIISLIITFYIIAKDEKSTDIKLQELKEDLLNQIEKVKYHPNTEYNMKTDSLNIE